MPKLLLITNFPECTEYEVLDQKPTHSPLIDRCRQLLHDRKYWSSNYMFCVISDGEDWQVLHPVISNLKGGTKHPRNNGGWTWLSGENYSEEDRRRSHEIFTQQLRRTLDLSYTAVQANVSMQNEPRKTSVPKSAAPAQPAVKKNADPNLQKCKTIIQENFEKFQKVYKAENEKGIEFCDSNDVTMFYRNVADIAKVQEWNSDAKKVDVLIDLCAFNEAFLGNIDDPDLLILGKNPGAKDIDKELTEEALKKRIAEIKDRRICAEKKCFYPLSSVAVMWHLPWFANRLIFGVGNGDPTTGNLQSAQGILSRFIGDNLQKACDYASRIASVELVPYHTKNFGDNAKLRKKFGVVEEVKPIVKKAIERGAVILCPYYGAVKMWLKNVPALAGHKYFYTTDERDIKPFPPGSLNINRLRHYSKVLEKKPREEGENCEPLFNCLVELGWKRIK